MAQRQHDALTAEHTALRWLLGWSLAAEIPPSLTLKTHLLLVYAGGSSGVVVGSKSVRGHVGQRGQRLTKARELVRTCSVQVPALSTGSC